MRFGNVVLSVLASLFVLTSCRNELDLNAPYKEIPTIYALLNPYDSVQTIRINKVFLGEGDANQMAKVSDSINYPENELSVYLERFLGGKKVKVCYSDNSADMKVKFREKMIEANPGAFSTQQRVYFLSDSLYPTGEYHLTVKNERTGNEFKAKASAIERVDFSFFQPLNSKLGFPYPLTTDPKSPYFIDYSLTTAKDAYDVRYLANEAHGYVYQLIIRFVIHENTAGGKYERYVDYNAGTRSLRDVLKLPGGSVTYLSHSFTGGGIFSAVGLELSKDKYAVLDRKLYRLDYFVYTANRDYFDYLEYQKPSLSVTQSKPLYSNFDESKALGIFAFRTRRMISLQPKAAYVSSFSDNPSTCQYQFLNFDETRKGCR